MTPQILLLVVVALLAANLPFISNRALLVLPQPQGKHAAWRLLELVLLYFIVGGLARLLEGSVQTVARQHWEFYAVTACLFIVFAFPGFVWRYLWRHH